MSWTFNISRWLCKIFANINIFILLDATLVAADNVSGDFKRSTLVSWGAKKIEMSMCQQLSTQWFASTANACVQEYAVSHIVLFDC